MDHSIDPEWLKGCELLHRVAEKQRVRTAALGWWGEYSPKTGARATYVSRAAVKEREVPRDVDDYLTDDQRGRPAHTGTPSRIDNGERVGIARFESNPARR